MNSLKIKIITLAAAFMVLLYFTNDFGLIDIEKTAIVIALGIDIEGEEFSVTAQIAVPNSTETPAKTKNSVIEGKGKTLAEAVDDIGLTTGWYPMLTFCKLVLLGKGVTENDVTETLNYFIRSDSVPDSALVAACEEKAKEVIESGAPLDDASSFALEKILYKDIAKSSGIAEKNVKDFMKETYSVSACSYMPVLKKIEVKTEQSEDNAQESSDEKQSKSVFDATRTYAFCEGIRKFTLEKDETLVYNIMRGSSLETFIAIGKDDGLESEFMLNVTGVKCNAKYDFGEVPRLTIELDATVNIEDSRKKNAIKDLTPQQKVPPEVLEAAKKKIEKTIQKLFEKAKENKCDIFKLKEKAYKYHYDEFERFGDDLLASTELELRANYRSIS